MSLAIDWVTTWQQLRQHWQSKSLTPTDPVIELQAAQELVAEPDLGRLPMLLQQFYNGGLVQYVASPASTL